MLQAHTRKLHVYALREAGKWVVPQQDFESALNVVDEVVALKCWVKIFALGSAAA
jgi:hypothetical protein